MKKIGSCSFPLLQDKSNVVSLHLNTHQLAILAIHKTRKSEFSAILKKNCQEEYSFPNTMGLSNQGDFVSEDQFYRLMDQMNKRFFFFRSFENLVCEMFLRVSSTIKRVE